MKKTQWIHRTAVKPMFLNLASINNGFPILLNGHQYITLLEQKKINDSDIVWLDHNFWTADKISPEDTIQLAYIKKLEDAGVSREDYLHAREENYRQQLNSYFQNGLYVQRPLIETTATRLDVAGKNPDVELQKMLGKSGFGFVSGDNSLSGLSHRDLLNVLLVLEIPEECVSGAGEEPKPVFKDTEKPIEIMTAYFGPRETTKVIPAEYIKCAYVVGSHDKIKIDNQSFNSDLILEEGSYDFNVLKDYVNRQMETNYSPRTVFALDNLITKYYASSMSYSGYNTLINIVEEKLSKIIDKENASIEDMEAFSYITDNHQLVYESQRTPLQEVRDKLKNESKTMSSHDMEQTLLALLKESKKSLQESYKQNKQKDEMQTFEECLSLVTPDVYKKIYNSSYANDIIGELEIKRKIVDMLHHEYEKSVNYNVDSIVAENEEDRLQSAQKMQTSDNTAILLNYAVRCDGYVAEKFVKYLNDHDISQMNTQDCMNLIPLIRDKAKEGHQERTF